MLDAPLRSLPPRRMIAAAKTLAVLCLGLSVHTSALAEVVETFTASRIQKEIRVIDGYSLIFADGTTLPLKMIKAVFIDETLSPAEQEQQRRRILELRKRVNLFDVQRGQEFEDLFEALLQSRFQDLDNLLNESLSKRARYGDGYWKLPMQYSVLSGSERRNIPAAMSKRIDDWIAQRPQSNHARAIKILHKLVLSDRLRRAGRTSSLRAEAKALSRELARVGHNNPAIFDIHIALARTEKDKNLNLQLVAEAARTEPEYWPAYTNGIIAMLPRWGGSSSDIKQLLTLIDKHAPEALQDEFYYRVAATLFRDGTHEYARADLDWQRIKRGFQNLSQRYDLTDGWHHRMATIAFVERDLAAMKDYFAQTYANGSPTELSQEVWVSGENLVRANEHMWIHGKSTVPQPYKATLRAIVTHDAAALKALNLSKAQANAADHLGNTLMHTAVAVRNKSAVVKLSAIGANPNRTNGYGRTALHDAAEQGSATLVQELLSAGADPLAISSTGNTPLLYSAHTFSPAVHLLLLEAAPDAVSIANERGETPLIKAIKRNNLDFVVLLDKLKALPLNAVDHKGYSALHHAVTLPDGAIAQMLLAAGADHSIVSKDGWTVFAMARASRREEHFPLLREYGVEER